MDSNQRIMSWTCNDLGDRRSVYVRPYRVEYIENNVAKIWDGIHAHDAVSILMYGSSFIGQLF
jgi:hypothetical protein